MTCTRGRGYSASFLATVNAILIFSAAFAAGSSPPLYLPAVTYSTGASGASSVTVADVNGDGKPDLVLANYVGGAVSVLSGNGDGTFQPAVVYGSGGSGPFAVAVADINGDGRPDIVVANSFSGNVGVLLNNGDDTFKPAVVYGTGGAFSFSVAVADVNDDGKPDVVVANESGNLGVLLGNGDGSFQMAVTYAAEFANAVAIADVNGDGKPDLVFADAGSDKVGVVLGNGDGTFQAQVGYSSGAFDAWGITVADVNGDSKPDLVVAIATGEGGTCTGSGDISVLLGNGDGTFQPPVVYGSGGCDPQQVAIADVDHDGKADLLVANNCDQSGCPNGSVGLLLGNGDGTFQPVVIYGSGGVNTVSIAVVDLNGDGKPDIAVANINTSTGNATGSVGILLHISNAPTTTTLTSSLNPAVVAQAIKFRATVSSSFGAPRNGETVTFHNGSAVLGTGSLSGGTAWLTTSSLATGVYTMTASYAGDSTFAASTSPKLRQVVNSTTKSATTTTIASSLNPSIYGQKVTWTAHVASSGSVPPTGTVTFRWQDFTESFSVGSAMLDSNGVATLTRSNLNADPYPLTAVYNGDRNNLGSTSAVLNQVVTQTTSSATVTSSPNPSAIGQAVTFTAKITSPTVTARGPVTFKVGTTVLGTAQLSGGRAILTTSSLPLGSIRVTVSYAGNSNIAKSSASVTQVVQP